MYVLKRLIVSILILGITISGYAQKPGDLLDKLTAKSPIEKIYLHFDREVYRAGETAWFKAYLYSEFFSDTISTSLYVDLIDNSSKLIAQKISPIIYGNAVGQFELPDSLQTGTYFIRAYSPTILNHNHHFLYEKRIQVIGKFSSASKPVVARTQKLDFFPESGNFVAGFPNTVAFKYTDANGMSQPIDGVIKNGKDETVTSFSVYHDGLGMFDITPQVGEQYYALLNNDSYRIKYFLPEVVAKGLVFKIIPNAGGKDFELYQNSDDLNMRGDYMIGQMQHKPVFRLGLNKEKNDINGFINTQQLRSGIMHITVFNKDDMPLAERICFVDNKEYIQPAELITGQLSFAERGKNSFTLSLPDTVAGSFSIAITDATYSLSERRNENIISSLLLTGDLKGEIYNPAYYFSSNDDSITTALDILMMTHGWRRFTWAKLPQVATAPLLYTDKGYISISGNVKVRDSKKPLAQKELLALLFSMDDSLSTSMQIVNTDEQGKFSMDSLIFFGNTRFFVGDFFGKKSKWLDIFPEADSITNGFAINYSGANRLYVPLNDGSLADRLATEYANAQKEKGIMLEGITMKVRKKTPIEGLEERYASGLFTGASVKTVDLVNTEEIINQVNIFDYIQSRIAGVNVERTGTNYQLFYQQRRSLMGGPIPMTLFLNEIETPAIFIASIPANQIAMIKVFTSFVGSEGNAPGGVLALYTKQHSDLANDLVTSADMFQYKGYSIIKEFYSPDYSDVDVLAKSKGQDQRITLHWQPDIIMDGTMKDVPIQFYNNDRTKSFKVIVEGITEEGKMLLIEKIIKPQTKGF